MSDKLTERERWLMTEAFMRGYEWGHDDTTKKNYMTRTKRTSELCREWLDTQSQVGATFGQALADMAPKPAPEPPAPAPKILIDSMDAWVDEQGTGIDEGKA